MYEKANIILYYLKKIQEYSYNSTLWKTGGVADNLAL